MSSGRSRRSNLIVSFTKVCCGNIIVKLQRFGSPQSFGSGSFHLNGYSEQKRGRSRRFNFASSLFRRSSNWHFHCFYQMREEQSNNCSLYLPHVSPLVTPP